MPGNEDPENLAENPPLVQASLSSGISQEEQCHDRSVDLPVDARPPLGVKLTVYRLLTMSTMLSLCFAKGILTYKGLSTVPTTLDWVSGGVLSVLLYSVGLYEGRESHKWEWFFQVDLAPAIGYFTKRVIGAALWLLFYQNLFLISYEGSMSGMIAGLLRLDVLPSYVATSVGAKWAVILGVFFFALGFQYCLGVVIRQVRARTWASRWAIVLIDNYGPGVTLAEQYWWFGLTGTVVGLFCGLALAGLPVVVVFLISTHTYDSMRTPP